MAGSLNKVFLIGHLGKDPEIRQSRAGEPIASFSLATSKRWTDKATGEKREQTEWHQIVIFNERLCGVAERYMRKGSLVHIEGELRTRKWQDQSGNDRYTTEVVIARFEGDIKLLDPAERRPQADSADDYGTTRTRDQFGGGAATQAAPAAGRLGTVGDLDDEIPF